MPRKAEHWERGVETIPQLLDEGDPHLSSLRHLISSGHPSPSLQILTVSVHHQKPDLLIPS